MTSWANTAAAFLSEGEGSSCIGGGQAYTQAPRLLHILKRGGRVEGWLGRVSASFFLLAGFLWLWLKHVKQRRY